MRIIVSVAVLALAVLLAGCVEIGNVKVRVTKYSGDCMPPVTRIPCCEAFPQAGFPVSIDGERYTTDANGEIVLTLSRNATHALAYQGCRGENETLDLFVSGSGVTYGKRTVQGNAAYTEENTTSSELVEINLPCCTA